MGAKWKLLTDEQKGPYNALADDDKLRYQREKAQWDLEQHEVKRHKTAESPQQEEQLPQLLAQLLPQQPQQHSYGNSQADSQADSLAVASGGMGWWQ